MWRHAWRDVRWKLALMAIVNTAISAVFLDDAVAGGVWIRRLSATIPMLFAMNAIVLASAGIATQVSQRPGQVVHSSMLFLLSLPLSRKRLVLVREATGVVAALSLMLLTLGAYWLLTDELQGAMTAMQAVRFVLAVASFMLLAYSVSAVFSTVLDQLWQTYAALGLVSVAFWAIPDARFWGHAFLPDGTTRVILGITACVLLSVVLVWCSVRVVERKQF
jgi:hypothetical protein